ncbi:MAG: hypothetical protein M1834_005424 [Cirrosporium novae-zelandiae]|nr:MAG: hypothetical protein M1834_005424 [Cirrosporium novae-zelandiae]
MIFTTVLLGLSAISGVFACAQHENHHYQGKLSKRSDAGERDWAYPESYNWALVNEEYGLCQNGTMQSPLQLTSSKRRSANHIPTFNYPTSVSGNFYNWGFGPAFTVTYPEGNVTGNPSLTFDNETVYLKGWHIHSPSEHVVSGERTRAEIHFVHVDEHEEERAVVAMRVNPGTADSAFFSQLPSIIGHDDTTQVATTIDLTLALDEVQQLNKLWTYQGSLTTPPCTEGIRWFVGQTIMTTGVEQMQEILASGSYSARVPQMAWQHQLNV